MQLCLKYDKPTCQSYHEKSFVDYDFNWKLINGIHHIAKLETKIRIFQYKLLNNVLYLNKNLFQFGIISQSKCSFCELYDETPLHIFYKCTYVQNWWNQLRLYLLGKVALPALNPQSAIFGFTDVSHHNFLLVNHLLLIFKYDIYNSRVNNSLSFQSLKCVISQAKYIEETISNNDLDKKIKNFTKMEINWSSLLEILRI